MSESGQQCLEETIPIIVFMYPRDVRYKNVWNLTLMSRIEVFLNRYVMSDWVI